jgi:competence protein ComEC
MGIGISLYFSLDDEPNFLLNSITFALTAAASIFVRSRRWIFYALLTVSFGFFASQLRTKTVDTFMLSENDKKIISLVGVVESCEKTEKGLIFTLDSAKIRKYPQLRKLQLTWRGKKATASKKDYPPGTKTLFRAILSPIYPQAFPNAYDFKKQQYFKGIGARGFIVKEPKILKTPKKSSLGMFINQLRHSIDKKIEKYLPKEIAAVSKALVTGNKSEISKEIRGYFANSGTAHLLAISGLHMGIIGFFIFWLFRILLCCFPRICMFYDVKKISALISWAAVLFYLYISGNSVPSRRAFIMHTIIIAAIIIERCSLTMRSVAIAATIIMVFSPEVILFPSFQMSFGAVIAIVAFYERIWNFSGFFKTLFSIISTTMVASIPTAIFSVYTFNQLTLNSILANIASIPLMTFFVMPTAIIALFFMAFDLARPFILLMGYGVNILTKISELSSQLPGSHFIMSTPTTANMAIFVFSGLLLTLIHHKIRFFGLIGAAFGAIYYCFSPTPDIFISPGAKVIGIKTDDAVCFSHLGYFRSMTAAWAKSVGFERRERLNSKACQKYIFQNSNDDYVVNVKNQNTTITRNKEVYSLFPNTILLDKENDFAEIIYLPSRRRISNKSKTRPWS